MKFNLSSIGIATIIVQGFLAQNNTQVDDSPLGRCLAACDAKNAGCKADCNKSANLTVDDINKITKCTSDCSSNKDLQSDSLKMVDCIKGCSAGYGGADGHSSNGNNGGNSNNGNSGSRSGTSSASKNTTSGASSSAVSNPVYLYSAVFAIALASFA